MDIDDQTLAKGDLGPQVLAVVWGFSIAAIVVVAIRFYTKGRILRRLTIDDYTILLALVFGIINSAMLTVSVHWGLGKHIRTLTAKEQSETLKWMYLCEIFCIMCPGFARISFGLLLLSILPRTAWRRRVVWTAIIAQFIVDIGTIVISYAQCHPVKRYWDPNVHGTCWDPIIQQFTGFFQGSVCSLTDLVLSALPASLFWSLSMPRKTKISLSLLMGLGIFGMIASIIKTVEYRTITAEADLTYEMANLSTWWAIEGFVVLIGASIPTLRPLLNRNDHKSFSSGPGKFLSSSKFRKAHPSEKKGSNGQSVDSLDTVTKVGSELGVGPYDATDIPQEVSSISVDPGKIVKETVIEVINEKIDIEKEKSNDDNC